MNEEFVDVAAIEKELKELWADMAAGKEQKEAVTRSCVHNLIVFAPGDKSDAEVNVIIGEVTVQNPGRVFILLPDLSSQEKKVSAWVSAQCYRTSGMRQQVCCEQIMVRAQGDAIQGLPSILEPLTIPDLPVFVWWRAPLTNSKLFNELLEFADRTIVDTSLQDDTQTIQEIIRILSQNHAICAFSDLNWARVTIWRELIARLFDSADTRSQLNEITRVEITARQPLSLQPLFLISWLGSRLKWRVDSKIKNEGDNIVLRCINGNNNLVDIVITKADKDLSVVRLHTTTTLFSVSATPESFHSEVSSLSTQKVSITHDKRIVRQNEADLLRKELQILGRDMGYEQAIQFLDGLF